MSVTLTAAINHQLTTRTKRNSEGKLLCRRCNNVVPPDYSIVFWDPSDETKVWGPCCSDECICHLKICSECNRDFIIDKEGEITHVGDGVWLCKECLSKVEICPCCNKRGSLVDSPEGRMCKRCFENTFFLCKDCNTLHNRDNRPNDPSYIAMWSHVVENNGRDLCTKCFSKRTEGKEPMPVASCEYCGDIFTIHSGGDKYCQRCIDRGDVQLCNHCGNYTMRWETIGDNTYCHECSPKVVICSCCKERSFFSSDGIRYRGKHKTYLICNECGSLPFSLNECPSCMSLTKGLIKKVKGKKEICTHCEMKYKWCPECNEFHFGERYCRTECCSVCDYSYKPHPYFNGSLNSRVFFGFENEINYIDNNYEEAKTTVLSGYPSSVFYAKRDSSISGQGFELVSHPMTLEFFNGLDLEPMFRVKPRVQDSSCGLHVHVSRESFDGQAHLFKLTEFINNNKSFTKKIAGRDFNNYAREYQDKISKVVKGTAPTQRYHAVNLTGKSTVEIRIFKSARNEFQLRYRIEFVSAAIEYTRGASLKALSDHSFKLWLKTQPGYSELKKFLKLTK